MEGLAWRQETPSVKEGVGEEKERERTHEARQIFYINIQRADVGMQSALPRGDVLTAPSAQTHPRLQMALESNLNQ